MRVLLIGGSGFLGTYTAKALRERGHLAVIMDRRPPGEVGAFILGRRDGLPPFVEGDATVPSDVMRAAQLSRCDAIVTMAAVQMIAWCNEHPEATYRVNVMGPLHALEAARILGVRRVVHVSSAGALCQAVAPVIREDNPISDVRGGHPAGHYGASKAAAEVIVLSYGRVQEIETIILRFPSLYGLGSPHGVFITRAVEAAARGEGYHAATGRDARRDYVYAPDGAQAVCRALECRFDSLTQRVFFAGSGKLCTDGEVCDLLRELVPSCDISIGPGRSELEASLETIRAVYDITKAREELGYHPRYSLREGLSDYLDQVRAHASHLASAT